jgi:hypothetical protein
MHYITKSLLRSTTETTEEKREQKSLLLFISYNEHPEGKNKKAVHYIMAYNLLEHYSKDDSIASRVKKRGLLKQSGPT